MSDDLTVTDRPGPYTHGHERPALASHAARTAANSAAYLLPHLRPGMSVLDVGCGPGTITLDLAELVGPGLVVGVENAEAPLLAARGNAADRGDDLTRFERADALRLPFEDGAFDVVHAHQVLQHLVDPVRALREMVRVCRPGGWIAARDADHSAMAWYPEVPELQEWRQSYMAMARRNGGEPDAGRRLGVWARQAGLDEVRLSSSTWTYAEAHLSRWWGDGQAARVETDSFAAQAAAVGLEPGRVGAIAEGWRAWGRHRDAWFVIVHGELLARAR